MKYFMLCLSSGKIEQLGAGFDVSPVQVAVGEVHIKIVGIQLDERPQILAASRHPRGKFLVEIFFDLDEGHHGMLVQLVQKRAGKRVGRGEGRQLGGGAPHVGGRVQGFPRELLDGFGIDERLLVLVGQRVEFFPFVFRKAVSEFRNPFILIHDAPVWLRGTLRAGVPGRGRAREMRFAEHTRERSF